jgi:hypothetical protein
MLAGFSACGSSSTTKGTDSGSVNGAVDGGTKDTLGADATVVVDVGTGLDAGIDTDATVVVTFDAGTLGLDAGADTRASLDTASIDTFVLPPDSGSAQPDVPTQPDVLTTQPDTKTAQIDSVIAVDAGSAVDGEAIGPQGLDASALIQTVTLTATATNTNTGTGTGTGGGGGGGPVVTPDPSIAGWPANINFIVNCGSTPGSQQFTLTNVGTGPATITSGAFLLGAGFTFNNDIVGKVINPGDKVIVTVSAPAVPSPSPIGLLRTDTLSIKTNIPYDVEHKIALSESAQGAILNWSLPEGFGNFRTPATYDATSQFGVVNTGTGSPVIVTLVASVPTSETPSHVVKSDEALNPFSVDQFSDAIGQGEDPQTTLKFTAPNFDQVEGLPVSVEYDGQLSMQVSGAICSALPSPVALVGISDKGAVRIPTATVTLTPACGATATGSFDIQNIGAAAFTWTESVSKYADLDPDFTVSPTTSSTDPGASSTVAVSFTAPISTAIVIANVNITTDIPGDGSVRSVGLTAIPQGANIVTTALDDFGSLPIALDPVHTSRTFRISNAANPQFQNAAVVNLVSDDTVHYSVSPAQVSLTPGTYADVTVTFTPGSDATDATPTNNYEPLYTGHINWTLAGENSCGATSGSVTAIGHGTLAKVSVDFKDTIGKVNAYCDNIVTQGSIDVTVRGNTPGAAYTVSLKKNDYFSIHEANGNESYTGAISTNGTSVFTVNWKLPSAATGTNYPALGTYPPADSNVITLTYGNETPITIPLTMTVSGVVLNATVGSQTAHQTGDTPVLSITNNGNLSYTPNPSIINSSRFESLSTFGSCAGGAYISKAIHYIGESFSSWQCDYYHGIPYNCRWVTGYNTMCSNGTDTATLSIASSNQHICNSATTSFTVKGCRQ